MYRRIGFPLLSRMDAEQAHDLTLRLLHYAGKVPGVESLLRALTLPDDPRLQVQALGCTMQTPIGVAAGLDKNAVAMSMLGALGFGHVEVGTVTPRPQPGNPRPRVFRLPQDQALINRMGFPGQGMVRVGRRLQQRGMQGPRVGVNIGANKPSVEAGTAIDDYLQGMAHLWRYADYLAINVSSPNTARLRELQGPQALSALLKAVMAKRAELGTTIPVLVKIAPDLTEQEVDDLVGVALAEKIDGIIATNTTLARPQGLKSPNISQQGGLSGAPLRDRSTEVIRQVAARAGESLTIIGVGGVMRAEDVVAKLEAGAKLVQVYTGFIYNGPAFAARLNAGLLDILEQRGLNSIEAVAASRR